MNLWTIAGGAAQILAGRAAVKETKHLMQMARIALIMLATFVGFVAVTLMIVDVYVILKIVEWFY